MYILIVLKKNFSIGVWKNSKTFSLTQPHRKKFLYVNNVFLLLFFYSVKYKDLNVYLKWQKTVSININNDIVRWRKNERQKMLDRFSVFAESTTIQKKHVFKLSKYILYAWDRFAHVDSKVYVLLKKCTGIVCLFFLCFIFFLGWDHWPDHRL